MSYELFCCVESYAEQFVIQVPHSFGIIKGFTGTRFSQEQHERVSITKD